MKPKRQSNQLKQKQLETKYLEEQTRKMEDKLGDLKRQIQEQKKMRTEMNLDSTVTRWQKQTKAPATGTLKSYAKRVLEEQKQAYQTFGINPKKITGTKTFEGVLKKIKNDKEEQEEKNPTKVTTFLKEPSRQESPPRTIQSDNFFKAKMDVKSLIKQKTLQDFLEENFILEYIKKFNEEGIHDLEGLRYVSRERLNEMGVKAGHQVKIIKKIKEEFNKMLAGKYQEPKVEKPSEKVESGYGEGDVNVYNDVEVLQQEQKQEEELRRQMQNIKIESKVEPEPQQTYSDEQQDEVIITAPMHSIELQVNQQQKANCYQCYKVIRWPELHYDQKYFCSQICLQKFMVQLRKTCPSCGKVFIKTEGYRQQGMWFCSLPCCPNQEQIQQLFFKWHRGGQ